MIDNCADDYESGKSIKSHLYFSFRDISSFTFYASAKFCLTTQLPDLSKDSIFHYFTKIVTSCSYITFIITGTIDTRDTITLRKRDFPTLSSTKSFPLINPVNPIADSVE